MPDQYRKKPVVIEAARFETNNDDGSCCRDIVRWVGTNGGNASTDYTDIWIKTLEGNMRATVGDWIIKGVAGEFYPCKPEIFEATYDPA